MKKLSTLFAIVALSATIGLAGCKKKDAAETKDQTAEPAKADDKAAAKPEEKKDTAAPTPTTPAKDDKPAAAGDLPAECAAYKAAIDKLAACGDKVPQAARDSATQAFEAASKSWASLAPEAKANLGASCKAGTDSVTAVAKTPCGW